jgi:RHS repeat-associated protein
MTFKTHHICRDENGVNLRSASYTAKALRQYTSRSNPASVDIIGLADVGTRVTVNSMAGAYRHGQNLSMTNNTYPAITVLAGTNSVSGSLYVLPSTESYTYDDDGNLTSDGRWTYTWDAENRLIRMIAATSEGPQQRLDFEYDAGNRRIRKTVWNNTGGTGTPTSDLKFLYDGWNMIAELDASSSNAVIRSYLWGLDLSGTEQGAGGVGGLLAVKTSSGVCHFVSHDGNGNVVQLVDGSSGTSSAQYEYGPFGEVLRVTGPIANANAFRFATKYKDGETGLDYYGFRYYNSVIGRWISRDPFEQRGGLNIIGFCVNNPVQYYDVDGRKLGYGMVLGEKPIPLKTLPPDWLKNSYLGSTILVMKPTANPRRKDCWYDIAIGGEALIEYRYYYRSPEALQHEMVHVKADRGFVGGFNRTASQLAEQSESKLPLLGDYWTSFGIDLCGI